MTSPAAFLAQYDAMCDRAAAQVIGAYSSSFSLTSRVLAPSVRRDIRNLYAVVRIADEIVDGTAVDAGEDPAALLDAYERQVLEAPARRFHTDPVLHAYAGSARRCGFAEEHIRAFFASMRCDAQQTTYSPDEFATYVYGSAEVIGLLCLTAFLRGTQVSAADRAEMEAGARALGSAFQKINFLRDLGEDGSALGRTYFPQLRGRSLDDATKDDLVAGIRAELDRAGRAIPLLPGSARVAVAAAEALFRELTDMVDNTAADELAVRRISVPTRKKLLLTARAVAQKGLRS